jgi:hypothetical protein
MNLLTSVSQSNMGWWNTPDSTLAQSWADKMGWVKSKGQNPDNLLRDNAGNFFHFDGPNRKFMQVNESGRPVDQKGNEVSEDKALHLRVGDPDYGDVGTDTMYHRALVTPATGYLSNPTEEMADFVQAYRLDDSRRENLLRSNPQVYEAVKNYDQHEIDSVYKPGTMMRNINGELIPASEEARERVRKWEAFTSEQYP